MHEQRERFRRQGDEYFGSAPVQPTGGAQLSQAKLTTAEGTTQVLKRASDLESDALPPYSGRFRRSRPLDRLPGDTP